MTSIERGFSAVNAIEADIASTEQGFHDAVMLLAWESMNEAGVVDIELFLRKCKQQKLTITPYDAESIAEYCKNTLIGESHE